jgi:hypothetical protein
LNKTSSSGYHELRNLRSQKKGRLGDQAHASSRSL